MTLTNEVPTICLTHNASYVKPGHQEFLCWPSIQHWQLRDLIACPTTSREIYYVRQQAVKRFDTEKGDAYYVLKDLAYKPSSMTCSKNFVATGGLEGQLTVKDLSNDRIVHHNVSSAINNSLNISTHAGETRLLVCNNDKSIKVYSLPGVTLVTVIQLPTPVNAASVSDDGRYLVAVGDSNDVYLYEIRNCSYNQIAVCHAAGDASFSCAWNSRSDHFAIASQEGVVAVWDIKNTHRNVARLSSQQSRPAGACRNVKFSPGNVAELLMFTEHASYVHLVDSRSYSTEQVLKLGGTASSDVSMDISGATFAPDSNSLFIGTHARIYRYDIDVLSRRVFQAASFM